MRVIRAFAVTAAVLASVVSTAARRPDDSLLIIPAAHEPGQKLTVAGQVVDTSGRALAGVQLHVYQTDASGRYTPERAMDEPHARLSGWLRTDAGGRFEIRTIRPGGYPKAIRLGDRDRKIPAHIHIDVTAKGYASRRLQLVFADDPLLSDPYWQKWVKQAGHPVVSVTRKGSVQSATVVLTLQRDDPR